MNSCVDTSFVECTRRTHTRTAAQSQSLAGSQSADSRQSRPSVRGRFARIRTEGRERGPPSLENRGRGFYVLLPRRVVSRRAALGAQTAQKSESSQSTPKGRVVCIVRGVARAYAYETSTTHNVRVFLLGVFTRRRMHLTL